MKQRFESLARLACNALLATALAGAALLPFEARAQLPRKISFIVPFPPGGPIDLSARVLSESMRAQTGIPVIVENRPGAYANIAAMAVKQSAPDGEHLLFATSSLLTISPHLYSNLPYDAAADFIPVTTVTFSQGALVIAAAVPVRDLKEFIELARATRPPFAFSSVGMGGIIHGYIELFKDAAKVDLLHVPYKGGADNFTAVLGGQVTGTFINLSIALPAIRSGKVKVLGLVGTKRSTLAPEIPTLDEQGYAGIDFMVWTGVMAPRGTSPQIVNAIANAVSSALAPEAVRAKLAASGVTPWVLPTEEFSRTIKRESERWKKLIAEKNIRVE
ncbi:MAG: tripartite tricarboxylate transporter substrate binding protein [Betaproteobacteria bacterium]|nr:tripartite tricarboxylate transporter substrate binding protein [Betaproteobacteria bacterium]